MNPKVKDIIEWAICIVIAIIIALIFKIFIGTPTIVKQPSMYPTLKEGQRLFLNKWCKTINADFERGDIVTFEAPSKTIVSERDVDLSNPVAKYEYEPNGVLNNFFYHVLDMGKTSYIKRVIALPGEHIKIANNSVYINGEKLDEPYLRESVITSSLEGCYIDIVVPEGALFLMGDNRMQSKDSRSFGCIPIEKIESKVAFRFWPLKQFGAVE